MNRRSRTGCVDCRKAKVKCDEQRPTCGTCSRRKKACHGYSTDGPRKPLRWTTTAISVEGPPSKRLRTSVIHAPAATNAVADLAPINYEGFHGDSRVLQLTYPYSSLARQTLTPNPPRIVDIDEVEPYREPEELRLESLVLEGPPNTVPFTNASPFDHTFEYSLIRELSFFSNPNITPEKLQGVAIYFARHPAELVIGSEPFFIREMNSHVLATLQSNVEMVSDSLCAIGSVYLHNEGMKSGLEIALGSKIKTLARIRKSTEANEMNPQCIGIEQIMSMILAVVSMELIDNHYQPSDSSMSALHPAAAAMIRQSTAAGSTLSSTAKYMIRALARQDMIMALVYRKHLLIPTSVWLDEYCETSADRFMGFTMTLMPLLEELSELAEDVRNLNQEQSTYGEGCNLELNVATIRFDFDRRASELQGRISCWRPPYIPTFSGPSSLKFLLHANMYRSAALLYLHRLLHPHAAIDHEALTLAYDIFAHLSSDPRDNRLALFPIMLASCEFQTEADRRMAEDCFESIHKSRKTYTTWLTGRFVRERVWKARDKGEEWAWAYLAERWKGECVPI